MTGIVLRAAFLRRLAFCGAAIATCGLAVTPALGVPGDTQPLAVMGQMLPEDQILGPLRLSWSPDGEYLAGDVGMTVWVRNLKNGQMWIPLDEQGRSVMPHSAVAWSPKGTEFAVGSPCDETPRKAPGGIVIGSPVTRELRWVSDQCGVLSLDWSPDGKRLLIETNGLTRDDKSPWRDVFLMSLGDGSSRLVSTSARGKQGNGDSEDGEWSPDGRRICFTSDARNLVTARDTNHKPDIFVKNLRTGVVKRVSTDSRGNQGNGLSAVCNWSSDGAMVAFTSDASNLVRGDTNGERDVFVKNLRTGAVQRVSTGNNGKQGNDLSQYQVWSPKGRLIAFTSDATNLVRRDTNNEQDVFIKNLRTGQVTRASTGSGGRQGNQWSDEPAWAPNAKKIAFTSASTNLGSDLKRGDSDVFVKTLR